MKNCPKRTVKSFPVLLVILAVSVLWPFAASADELCIRDFDSADPIDGIVAPGESTDTCDADDLWPQVAPVRLHPTGGQVGTYMYIAQIAGTPPRLRIGIDTAGDPDVSNFDTIVLFFNANNNDEWDTQDFAIRIRVKPDSDNVIDSGEACGLESGAIQYYGRTDGPWDIDRDAVDDITVAYAYDYSGSFPDPERNIWNIELEIPINAAPPFQLDTDPDSDYFSIGAIVFADRNQSTPVDDEGQVRVWPAGLMITGIGTPITPQIAHYNNSPNYLQPADITALGNINLQAVCYDVTFPNAGDFWVINGNPANEYDEFVERNAVNDFRIYYSFIGPSPDAELREPNKGVVRLGIKPFNGGWAEEYWSQEKGVMVSTFGEHPVDFTFDLRDAPNPDFNDPDTTMLCAHAWLRDFELNDITTNDEEHMNLNYFSTSEVKLTMRLYGNDLPKRKSGQIQKVYLKFQMTNEHPKLRKDRVGLIPVGGGSNRSPKGLYASVNGFRGNSLFSVSWWLQLLGGLALITLSLYLMRRSVTHRWALNLTTLGGILLLIGPVLTACTCKIVCTSPDNGPYIGGARWQVSNAKQLGLRPVKGSKDLYVLDLNREQVKKLDLKFIGQPLPYKMKEYRLKPAVQGQPNKIDIPVKPGTVLTLLAAGNVDVDGRDGPLPPATPAGFTRKMPHNQPRTRNRVTQPHFFGVRQKNIGNLRPIADARHRYLLTEGFYAPHEHTGALVGSFNGFETSFVVGRHKSIVVPKNANNFSLAVNAMAQDYAVAVGGFNIGVIVTVAPQVPTRTIRSGDATYHIPPSLPPWHALTTLNVYTYYDDPLVQYYDDDDPLAPPIGVVTNTMRPWGHARFAIYDSHVEQFSNQK